MVNKIIQVMVEEQEFKLIADVCILDNRSMSNFLRDAGLKKAKELLNE